MEIRITRAHRVFSDGRHNAFTSINRLSQNTYIAFRSASSHVSYDGQIVLIGSSDLNSWHEVARFADAKYDCRDPKLVLFQNRMLLYFGARPQNGLIEPRGRVFSDNNNETSFVLQGIPVGSWLWSVASWRGELYGCAYARGAISLYTSSDGLHWRKLLDFSIPGNETAIDFGDDDTLWALVRNDAGGCIPSVCQLKPPYREISSILRLPIRLQGPMMKRLPGGCVIVCRRWNMPGRRNLRTDMFWLKDDHEIQYGGTFPSGGDTSYASWLDVEPGKAVMSYYLAHEHKMDQPCGQDHAEDKAWAEHTSPADIFLADISYADAV
ncbi:MAG: hypothetical protein PHP98_08915 [Kiritimatiellae bacterium]|nr:hypothetical protein [Kiritimatiellia bacterium]